MLISLHRPLEEGEHVPLTLSFEKAGAIEMQVTVQGRDATHPSYQIDHAPMGHSKGVMRRRSTRPNGQTRALDEVKRPS
jgi:periplasmic copper chaperone A